MKHKYKDIEGSRREFQIEVSAEEVKQALNVVYAQIAMSADIPGFRKGKAPRDVLEKFHGKTAKENAMSDLVSDSYRQALKESKTMPVALPKISDVETKESKGVTYKAVVDVRPKIKLKNYKNIKINKKTGMVTDDEVDKYLSAIRKSYAQFKAMKDLPEMNDEFAKGLGLYKDMAGLKEAAKKDLSARKELGAKSDMSSQALEHLLKSSKFTAPKGLVEEEAERLVHEAKEEMKKKKVSEKDIEKRDPELRKVYEKEAQKRVKLYFLLDEVARLEKIDVAESEIEDALKAYAAQSNKPLDEIKKYYQENNLLGYLRNEIRENKIIDFLIKHADIKEAN